LAQIPNSKFQIPNEIKKLVEEREKLRKEEKFKEADEVRDKIEKLGFRIEDSETGPAVKPVK
jgi:cysteinyl-tRNA synthetase